MNREATTGLDQHAPLFAAPRGDIEVSFEFFPPKSDKMAETLWQSIETLAPLRPRFVSVTYGAGGSTRERTHATVERLVRETDLAPAAHLTCVGASRGEIDDIARAYWDSGVRHIVALRGDPPEPGQPYAPHAAGLCQCRRAGRGAEEGRAVRNFGRGLSRDRIPTAIVPTATSTISSPRSTPAPTARSASSSSRPTISSASATASPRAGSISRSCRASCRCRTSPRRASSPGSAARRSPAGWTISSKGSTICPPRDNSVAATIAGELCGQLYAGGVRQFHFYTLNRAELAYSICHLLGVRA